MVAVVTLLLRPPPPHPAKTTDKNKAVAQRQNCRRTKPRRDKNEDDFCIKLTKDFLSKNQAGKYTVCASLRELLRFARTHEPYLSCLLFGHCKPGEGFNNFARAVVVTCEIRALLILAKVGFGLSRVCYNRYAINE
jgi:hypothetical protein